MIRKKLRFLVTEYNERNKKGNSAKVYSVTNSQGFVPSEVFSKNLSSYKVVRRGMIAYNPSRVNVGSIAVQRAAESVIVSPLYVVFSVNETELLPEFLAYYLHSDAGLQQVAAHTSGSVRDSLKFDALQDIEINLYSVEQQREIIEKLQKLESAIQKTQLVLKKINELSISQFVVMFGDLKSNSKGWQIQPFSSIASIDGKTTTDYKKYAKYPHIGIDSIEKETGELKGFRTVEEDGVISVKYLFTKEHIIYSKIRPNLNKVALPEFEGLCSADAYPILPKAGICNRVYLAYVMRSMFFLEYILQFSKRTNMPKVNREAIAGFNMPVPPIEQQNEFASFIEKLNKTKNKMKRNLEQLETCYKALLQQYFG